MHRLTIETGLSVTGRSVGLGVGSCVGLFVGFDVGLSLGDCVVGSVFGLCR